MGRKTIETMGIDLAGHKFAYENGERLYRYQEFTHSAKLIKQGII